jgi:hypothetical protein
MSEKARVYIVDVGGAHTIGFVIFFSQFIFHNIHF